MIKKKEKGKREHLMDPSASDNFTEIQHLYYCIHSWFFKIHISLSFSRTQKCLLIPLFLKGLCLGSWTWHAKCCMAWPLKTLLAFSLIRLHCVPCPSDTEKHQAFPQYMPVLFTLIFPTYSSSTWSNPQHCQDPVPNSFSSACTEKLESRRMNWATSGRKPDAKWFQQ